MIPDYNTMLVPDFRIGRHYYRLDPIREGGLRWRFRLTNDVHIQLHGIVPKGRVISFRDSSGSEWMSICYSGITVRQWYQWNGCTPKRYVPYLRFWIGTPDFDSAILASCVHDALYQFSCTPDFPLYRADCDEIFRRILLDKGMAPWMVRCYHWAVRKFGNFDGDPTEKVETSVVIEQ